MHLLNCAIRAHLRRKLLRLISPKLEELEKLKVAQWTHGFRDVFDLQSTVSHNHAFQSNLVKRLYSPTY